MRWMGWKTSWNTAFRRTPSRNCIRLQAFVVSITYPRRHQLPVEARGFEARFSDLLSSPSDVEPGFVDVARANLIGKVPVQIGFLRRWVTVAVLGHRDAACARFHAKVATCDVI